MTREIPAKMSTNPNVILTEMKDGSGVLLDLRTKFYFTLNETGVFAWKKIETSSANSLDALADAVTTEFEVERDAARADLERMVVELFDEGLLTDPR